jgi:hypothetical protein
MNDHLARLEPDNQPHACLLVRLDNRFGQERAEGVAIAGIAEGDPSHSKIDGAGCRSPTDQPTAVCEGSSSSHTEARIGGTEPAPSPVGPPAQHL